MHSLLKLECSKQIAILDKILERRKYNFCYKKHSCLDYAIEKDNKLNIKKFIYNNGYLSPEKVPTAKLGNSFQMKKKRGTKSYRRNFYPCHMISFPIKQVNHFAMNS